MLPTQITNYVAEGIGRLTSANRAKSAGGQYVRPNVVALVTALMTECQALENAAWQVITGQYLSNAGAVAGSVNQILDLLGKLVGQLRLGFTNSIYAALIALRIRANRSHGRSEDILQIAAALAFISANGVYPPGTPVAPAGSVLYVDGDPGSFTVELVNIVAAFVFVGLSILHAAKDLGVYGVMQYSTFTGGVQWQQLGASAPTVATNAWAYTSTGANSPSSGGVGGYWVASSAI